MICINLLYDCSQFLNIFFCILRLFIEKQQFRKPYLAGTGLQKKASYKLPEQI